MFKLTLTLMLSLFSAVSYAQLDSVAFFYTPQKINVLINERGEVSRLQNFMNFFNAGHELFLVSKDNDIKFACARDYDKATCTLTFYPSQDVQTQNRELRLVKSLENFDLDIQDSFTMSFRGSMKDNFHLVIENGVMTIFASKK